MDKLKKEYNVIIVGGGIFGLHTASILSSKGFKIALLEKSDSIFDGASKVNQSRVHRGYHYPRSYETARKLAKYYERFCEDFSFSLLKPFKQYYAISKDNSKISVSKYIQFCNRLKLPLRKTNLPLLNNDLIDSVFEVEESCFNYLKIKNFYINRFRSNKNVDIYKKTYPISHGISGSNYILTLNDHSNIAGQTVINTTYNNVNEINKMFGFAGYKVKYELCELMLCKGRINSHIGITVIDGPFFSLMPFADGNLFSLSSVEDTPIDTNYLKPQNDIHKLLTNSKKNRNAYWEKIEFLVKTYLKTDINLKYQSSVFEIKPILLSSEKDDSRPTIVTTHRKSPFFISVFAGKISTIYDLNEELNFL